MRNLVKNPDGTFTVILHLKEDERRQLKRLSKKLEMNDFETIKYSVQLVSWWAKNQIEPETD